MRRLAILPSTSMIEIEIEIEIVGYLVPDLISVIVQVDASGRVDAFASVVDRVVDDGPSCG
jgi:hypothetical protein